VNKYTFKLDGKELNVSLGFGTTIDEAGREDLIKTYEDDIVRKIINPTKDYEITRYRHAPLEDGSDNSPDIYYEFNFYDGSLGGCACWATNATSLTPPNNPPPYGYNFQGYTNEEIASNTSDLNKSFFKLDFYDKVDRTQQKFYMSSLFSPIRGNRVPLWSVDLDCDFGTMPNAWTALDMYTPDDPITTTSPNGTVITVYDTTRDVLMPTYHLDMDKKSAGYFFYWLKNDDVVKINEFFITAKFFNARDGVITRFLNQLPPTTPANNMNSFDPTAFLYYRVQLNKTNYTYKILDMFSGIRVGTSPASPIEYWEYINPT
tara:strand:- start:281 stop:1234 length:954 start_codon:yes stop_codon:yes gene_type:complete